MKILFIDRKTRKPSSLEKGKQSFNDIILSENIIKEVVLKGVFSKIYVVFNENLTYNKFNYNFSMNLKNEKFAFFGNVLFYKKTFFKKVNLKDEDVQKIISKLDFEFPQI